MSENGSSENLPVEQPEDDDGPQSALAALRPHLRQYLELRENEGLSQERCVETISPGRYANPKDAGWRWEQRVDYKAALAEMRAEAVKRAARSAADVLNGMWTVADRCMQAVRPVLNRKGEQVLIETAEGELAPAYEFDSNGAMRAYESLANYHGMTKTRTEVSGPNGGPVETKNNNINTNVPDDPVEAARFYREMIQADKSKK